MALVGALAANASAGELESARNDAERATASLEQRPCPALGDKRYLAGLSDSRQLVMAADKERAYQEGALQQLQQITRDPKLEPRQRGELQALASWSVAASMANWSLLQVAQQALTDPLITAGQPYPAGIVEAARERLRKTADSGAVAPDAANVMRRQATVVDRCAKSFGSAIFKLNMPQFDAAVDAAQTSAELGRVELQYRSRDAASGGYGGDSLEKLAARRSTLAATERTARDQATTVSAADAAKRQAEAQKRQAEAVARLPAQLATAKRFSEASKVNNEKGALAELSRDVVMATPNGTYRGIDQVTAAVRQQSASGQGGSLGMPRIEGSRILANGTAAGYRITTTFSFNDDDKISRIDIGL